MKDGLFQKTHLFKINTWTSRFKKSKLIFVIFLCLIITLAGKGQEKLLSIGYSKIIDSRPFTHSGQSVGGILKEINRIKTSQIDSEKLKTYQSGVAKWRNEVKKREKEFKDAVTGLAEKVNLRLMTLEQAKQDAVVWAEYVNQAKQELSLASYMLNLYTQRINTNSQSLKNLQSLVEPFLEPYTFLLEDALETANPAQRRADLIDIGDLFPEGEAQPAWADLVRTRRYFVLSNGKDYARIFVPGSNSQSAYQQNYKVLRHVLGWLWDSAKTEWTIDIYAYQNDLTSQMLKLNPTPHQVKINSIPPPPSNTVSLDLQAIKEFLDKKLTLEGAYINNEGTLVLYGSKGATDPTLEGQPIDLSDLAVAYRAVNYAGHGDAYISLDPSPYPEQVNVNFGGRLADTRMGWVVLRSDMRFKTLGTGFDPVIGEDLRNSIRRNIKDFNSVEERYNLTLNGKQIETEYTRFWFSPDNKNLNISTTVDRKLMKISSPRFTGNAVREDDPILGRVAVSEDTTPTWTRDTLVHLNSNYESFAKMFPELGELDNVGRLLALFTWLKQQKIKLDLDSLLSIELPKCNIPRRKPQLLVGYLLEKGQYKPINMSQVADEWANRRPRTEKSLTNSFPQEYDIKDEMTKLAFPNLSLSEIDAQIRQGKTDFYTVIGGGIDLSLTKTITKPKPIKPTELAAYQKLKQSSDGKVQFSGKTIERAMVGKIAEIKQKAPVGITHTVSENKPIPNSKSQSRRITNTDMEIVTTNSSSEKIQSLRRSATNSLSNNNSRIVNYGDNNGAISYIRYEKGNELTYKFSINDNLLNVEKTLQSNVNNEVTLINNSLRRSDPTSETWKNLSENTEILAFDRLPDNKTLILKKEGDSQRLIRYNEQGQEEVSFNGKAAIAEIDRISRQRVGDGSTGNNSFIHASEDGDKFILMVGKRRKEVKITEIEDLMNNPLRSKRSELDELFDITEDPEINFIIYRDALTRRPVRFGSSLREGSFTDPIQLIRLFRERYQGKRFLLDDETDIAKKNLAAIKPIKRPGEVGLLIPEKSFPVKDFGLIGRIKANLSAAGIVLIETPQQMVPIPNVLIVSGHNDDALIEYLTGLGEQGLLKDKVILLNTCYADGNPNLLHDIIQKYEPKAVYLHTQKISDVALDPVLKNLGSMLKEIETKGDTIHPADLFEKAINRTLMDKSLPERQLRLIRQLRPSLLQISYIRPLNTSTNSE